MRFGSYLEHKLELRHWIAIAMKNGFARGKRLYPAHYGLLYFTKGDPAVFRRPKLTPVRCRHCGDLVKDYGGYWPIVKRKGLNLSDMWEDLSPVRHANRKSRVANELPQLLADRVVAIAGRKHKVYIDPFVGAGSGAIAALNAGMHFVVGDLLKKNAALTAERIRVLVQGKRRGEGAK
jgi:site-specific DNA-methyltransferase (adenine-specific)